jgi:hypothetical protein
LCEAGALARNVEMPLRRKGCDLTTWFQAGRTADQLQEAIVAASPKRRRRSPR